MRKIGLIVGLVVLFAAMTAYVTYRVHRHRVRSQIEEAYAAVLTVEDYQGSGDLEIAQADLAAREKLDVLGASNLNANDQRVVSCIADFLGSMESLDSSQTIEDTELRTTAAEKAAVNAESCMHSLKRTRK